MVEIRRQRKTRGGVAKMIFKPKIKSEYLEFFKYQKIEEEKNENIDNFSIDFSPVEEKKIIKEENFKPMKISYRPSFNTAGIEFRKREIFEPTGFLIYLTKQPNKIDTLQNKITIDGEVKGLKTIQLKNSIVCSVTSDRIVKYGTVNKLYFSYLRPAISL